MWAEARPGRLGGGPAAGLREEGDAGTGRAPGLCPRDSPAWLPLQPRLEQLFTASPPRPLHPPRAPVPGASLSPTFFLRVFSEGEVCSKAPGSLHGGKASGTTLPPRARTPRWVTRPLRGPRPRPYDLGLPCTSSSGSRTGSGGQRPGPQSRHWSFETACAQKSHPGLSSHLSWGDDPSRVAVAGLHSELCGEVLRKLQTAEQMQLSLSPPPPCGFGGSQPR